MLALLQASCMVLGRLNKNKFNNRACTWAPDSLPLHSILQSMLKSEWGDVGDDIRRCWLQHWLDHSMRQSNSPTRQTTLLAKKAGLFCPFSEFDQLSSLKCSSTGTRKVLQPRAKGVKEREDWRWEGVKRTVRRPSMGSGEPSCQLSCLWNHTLGTSEQH